MIAYSNFSYDHRIRRESETLARFGYNVKFLVPAENNTPRRYISNDVAIIELQIQKYQGKAISLMIINYLRFLMLAFCTCTGFYLRHELDILHIHNMPNFIVFAGLIPRIFGKKIILDIHDSVPETFMAKFERFPKHLYKILCIEESICCKFAHVVICVNDVQKDALIKRGIPAKKVRVLLNVPDESMFKFDQRRGQLSIKNKSNFNIVYHGTIDVMRGIDIAIQAISNLKNRLPGIKLFILGMGKDLDKFIFMSKKLDLQNNIYFNRRNLALERLPIMLREMDLGIVPNRRNVATDLMLPVKLLEYVAIGIPVVAARLRTIERYFSEEMVIFFEPGNVESLTSAIWDIYENQRKGEKMAIYARTFLKENGWEKHQMNLIRLYQEL